MFKSCLLSLGLLSAGLMAKDFQSFQLKNGLEVILHPSDKVPLVTMVLCSKAGAMTEDPQTDGLTHLWEHMFFKGNQKIPDQEAFNRRIRELGIVYNGDTSAEKVRYYFTLPSAFTRHGLEFMYQAITGPLLNEEELSRERQVVLNEYDRNASGPQFDLRRLRRRLIYGDLAYLRDPLGNRELIATASREQLFKIKNEVFVPSNSAILISGAIDPKLIRKQVDKIFGSWQDPPGWASKKVPAFPPFPKSQEVVMVRPRARQVAMNMTFEGPRARNTPKDTYAADILIGLLQHRSGNFYKKYYESGLALQAGLGYYTQSQTGEIHIYGMAKADKAAKLKKILAKEPELWAKPGYFTAAQLEDVKRSIKIEKRLSLDKPSAYIKTLAFWWAVTGLDYYESYQANLLKTEIKDVQAFVKKYLIGKPKITTVFLSPQDAKIMGVRDNAQPLVDKLLSNKRSM